MRPQSVSLWKSVVCSIIYDNGALSKMRRLLFHDVSCLTEPPIQLLSICEKVVVFLTLFSLSYSRMTLSQLLRVPSQGAAAFVDSGATAAKNPLLGDIMIVAAQVLAATQFIVEEKYLAR